MRATDIFVFACILAMPGCASVPSYERVLDQQVSGGSPLSSVASKARLAKLRAQNPNADILQRHLAIEEAVAGQPLAAGNTTHLLRDGETTFRATFAAMRAARDHINLEYYILEDVESDGVKLSELLTRKLRAGVAVNIIYDSVGSSGTPASFFDGLKKSGAKVVEFNPMNPLKAGIGYSPNDRDHRKIMVVDGRIAIVGGVNLSKSYQSGPGSDEEAVTETPALHWRDTDIMIEGPAVAQLQKLFIRHWHEQDGPPLSDAANFYPKPQKAGDELVRILGSTPDDALPAYYVTLLSAIRNAEKNIWLSAAYFVPSDDEIDDLIDAAQRGVDVRLLLPSKSDVDLVLHAGRSHYTKLLKGGVKIYEMQGQILHSKTAAIDGVWIVVGSSNLDPRSVLFNDEVDAVVLGRKSGEALEAMFRSDQTEAKRIDLEAWKSRPILQRLNEFYSRFYQSML